MKLVRKEAFFPGSAHELPYILAPVLSCFTALLAFAVIPWGQGWTIDGTYIAGTVANVPISLILIFALGSIGIYGFIVGGWASDSKYAMLGAMRTCAQLVSYEVSLAPQRARGRDDGPLAEPRRHRREGAVDDLVLHPAVRRPLRLPARRDRRDLTPAVRPPEADTELVAGYHTEYSGMRWGLFQTAEYINMIVLSSLAVTLFFDGWHFPWVHSLDRLGPLWFIAKLGDPRHRLHLARASQPRLRYDQLMRFGWKVCSDRDVNALVTALLVVWV